MSALNNTAPAPAFRREVGSTRRWRTPSSTLIGGITLGIIGARHTLTVSHVVPWFSTLSHHISCVLNLFFFLDRDFWKPVDNRHFRYPSRNVATEQKHSNYLNLNYTNDRIVRLCLCRHTTCFTTAETATKFHLGGCGINRAFLVSAGGPLAGKREKKLS